MLPVGQEETVTSVCNDELHVLIKELDKRMTLHFNTIEESIKQHMTALATVRELASVELERRLDNLNHLYEQGQEDRTRFFTISDHNFFRMDIERRVSVVEACLRLYMPLEEAMGRWGANDKRLEGIERWQYGIAGGVTVLITLASLGAFLTHFWH